MEPFYASGCFMRELTSFHMNSGVNPTDPTYKDMFKTVTRKIYQTKPGDSRRLIETQSVLFGWKGVEGMITGTGAWQVGWDENNQFVAGGEASFAEYNAPQITGYDSYVNWTKVNAADVVVTNGTLQNAADVTITYQRSTSFNNDYW